MRKLFLILAYIFGILGIIFTFLPLGTLAFAPIAVGFLFAILALVKSDEKQKRTPKILLMVLVLAAICVLAKVNFIEDEIAADTNFEQTKIESEKDAQKTLEQDLE